MHLRLFGLMRYLESLFTDNVIGVILILIAITLLPHFASMVIGVQRSMPRGDPPVFGGLRPTGSVLRSLPDHVRLGRRLH